MAQDLQYTGCMSTDRTTQSGRALSQDNKLRCERCGGTFEQHCFLEHSCEGFLQTPTEFEEFGDYVYVGELTPAQARKLLQEQIDCRVPKACQSFVTLKHHVIPYAGVQYLTWTFKKEVK